MNNEYVNIDRFKGFAELYDMNRPKSPTYVATFLTQYLGYQPQIVVDIGCGTGLSTFIWKDIADTVIGIEPNEDMLSYAIVKISNEDNIEFIKAFSDNTTLSHGVADIVTCSQSFHWMEPISTLREVNRILKPGGIFAVYDCDWPPLVNPALDTAYQELDEYADMTEVEISDFKQYPKDKHLENIKNSGYFRFTREVVFANTESCDATRYYNLALSQGGIQVILKKNPLLIEKRLLEFKGLVDKFFELETLPIVFCYRMRLGVK